MLERFWKKVRKSEGCWIWEGCRHPDGYGRFWLNGKHQPAHRVAYAITHGPIPEGLWVLHRCDNPPCVRPDHLFLGTSLDNVSDRDRKGRGADVSGERHPRARLTRSDVLNIRAAKKNGIRATVIAEQFRVHRCHIGRIVAGTRW